MYNILLGFNIPILVTGLRNILEKTLLKELHIRTATTFQQIETALQENETQMLLLDMALVKPQYIKALKILTNQYPQIKIIIFYDLYYKDDVKRLYANGVMGFLPKMVSINRIETCIQRVYNDEIFIEKNIWLKETIRKLNEPYPTKKQTVKKRSYKKKKNNKLLLTNREKMVANLLIEEKTNAQICALLLLRPSTVSTFKKNIFSKLKITSLVELESLLNSSTTN